MPSRLVPLLLVLVLLAPSQAVAQPASAPPLEMPAELQSIERGWMEDAFADANATLESGAVNATEAERIRALMDEAREAQGDGQLSPMISNLVNLRVTVAYYEARADAEARNDTVGAFLDATVPPYERAQNDTIDLQRSINETQRSIETARALEALYVGSELVVQGAQELKLYSQYRSFLKSSGEDTHPRILQLLVQSAVGPRWSLSYASDVLDHAQDVDAAGEGPALNQSRLSAAQAFVADRARHHASDDDNRGSERLLREMNASARRGNLVFSMGIGGVVIGSAIHGNVLKSLNEGNITRQQVRSLLQEHGRNYTALNATLEAGYRGILQKDALALVEDVLAEDEPSHTDLARAVAQLDKAQILEQALVPLAQEQEAASDEDEAPGTSGRDILVAVGGGVALGAGAAALGRRYLSS